MSAPDALVTVATENFVPGAMVMIGSFLRTNPWFAGEVVVIHDGLSPESAARLRGLSPRVRLQTPSAELTGCIDRLTEALPGLAPNKARFYSADALRPAGRRRVLFCDSDMVFLDSVEDAFAADADLAAAGDGCFMRGRERRRHDYREAPKGEGTFGGTVNAGFMLFGPRALDGADFEGLLSVMSVERYRVQGSGLLDQAAFNLQFEGRTGLISWRYNFLVKHIALILGVETIAPKDIRVLHFNTSEKPWQDAWKSAAVAQEPFLRWAEAQWRAAEAAL